MRGVTTQPDNLALIGRAVVRPARGTTASSSSDSAVAGHALALTRSPSWKMPEGPPWDAFPLPALSRPLPTHPNGPLRKLRPPRSSICSSS